MARQGFVVRPYRWKKSDGTDQTSWEVYGRPLGAKKPYRKRLKVRADATALCRELNAQLQAGTLPLTTLGKKRQAEPTLLEWFDRFIESRRRNFKPRTAINHNTRRNQVQLWLETSGGHDRPIGQFKADDFEQMMAFFKTHPMPRTGNVASDNTLNGIHQGLTAVFNFVIARQVEENLIRSKNGDLPVTWVTHNPMEKIRTIKTGRALRYTAWSPAELVQIEAQLAEYYRPYFRVLVSTGMRLEEFRYLRWSEVDLASRTITITPTEDYRPKADMSRTLGYGKVVQAVLEGQIGRDPKWVFTGKQRGRQVNAKAMRDELKSAIKRTGLKIEGTVIHCTRATFITNLFRKGYELDRIMHLAGHKDPRVTMRYVMTDEAGQRKAMESLDSFFED
jgi:integrase